MANDPPAKRRRSTPGAEVNAVMAEVDEQMAELERVVADLARTLKGRK